MAVPKASVPMPSAASPAAVLGGFTVLLGLHPATVADLAAVMRADSNGRPPLHSPETLALIAGLLERAAGLSLDEGAPRPLLLGRHLIATGLVPGPDFKRLLDAAFEAQLDGAFADESTALIWLRNNLPKPPASKA